jgi:hypothetical protein
MDEKLKEPPKLQAPSHFGLKVSPIKRVAGPSLSAKMALRLDSLPPSYRLRGDSTPKRAKNQQKGPQVLLCPSLR